MVFPVYQVLADLAASQRLCPALPDPDLGVVGLGLVDKDERRSMLVANLTGDASPVMVCVGDDYAQVRVRHLNEMTAEAALRDPENYRADSGERVRVTDGCVTLNLLPYALVQFQLKT
jgi:hypothetical protein